MNTIVVIPWLHCVRHIRFLYLDSPRVGCKCHSFLNNSRGVRSRVVIWEQVKQFNKAQVSEETQRAAIDKIKYEAIGVGIENILKEAQVGKTRTETNAIIEGVKQKWEQVKQGWKNLDIAEKQNKINEFKATIDAQYPNVWNVAGRAMDDMITEVTTLGGALGERHKTKTIK